MIDSESACPWERARPRRLRRRPVASLPGAPHADEADSWRTIGEDVGTTPTGDGEAVSGRRPAKVWRVIQGCGGLESIISSGSGPPRLAAPAPRPAPAARR